MADSNDLRPRDTDIEKQSQEDLKTERARRILKWAVLVAVLTLLVIVAVAIPMALKAVKNADESFSSSSATNPSNDRPKGQINKPTKSPTFEPTSTQPPSFQPTISRGPSVPPSEHPSTAPTSGPTGDKPTQYPTPLFSSLPTLSSQPTKGPIDPAYTFKLRLFWQSGYFWQEQWAEWWYCVECITCEEYGAGDGWEHGCEKVHDPDECYEDDSFWIYDCQDDKRGAGFNILTNPDTSFQFRVAGTNLCMKRGGSQPETFEFKSRILRAVKCDSSDADQLWAPFEELSKFEMRPFQQRDWNEDDADCISQLHHPKSEELISMHGCKVSRIYETRYWEEY